MNTYILCDGITREPLHVFTDRIIANFACMQFLHDEGYAPMLLTYAVTFNEVTGITTLEQA
jgi:hypothetical protein